MSTTYVDICYPIQASWLLGNKYVHRLWYLGHLPFGITWCYNFLQWIPSLSNTLEVSCMDII